MVFVTLHLPQKNIRLGVGLSEETETLVQGREHVSMASCWTMKETWWNTLGQEMDSKARAKDLGQWLLSLCAWLVSFLHFVLARFEGPEE